MNDLMSAPLGSGFSTLAPYDDISLFLKEALPDASVPAQEEGAGQPLVGSPGAHGGARG